MSETRADTNVSDDLERLVDRSGEMMNGLLYTFKTHYKMAEWYEKFSKFADFIVAAMTGALAVLIIWEIGSQVWLITIALVVAFISWAQATLKFGVKAERHYNAADKHHLLFEKFDTFIKTEIPDEDLSKSEKKRRFRELSQTRDQLNELAPRTTNFWYKRVSKEDANATAANDKDEVEALTDVSYME